MIVLNVLMWGMAAAVLLPALVLAGECLLAVVPWRRSTRGRTAALRPRVAVLIPAHNEAAVIGGCLASLMPQLKTHDRVLVVADNCSDQTCEIARRYGADLQERYDGENRGKGYALDFGLCCLAEDAPDVVVMIDADCIVEHGALDCIARAAAASDRPVQASYLMEQSKTPEPRELVSALAVLVKNVVRPRGLKRLGLPCLLTGSGMAFPWHVIRQAQLASGNLVEDMCLGLDLLVTGEPPVFVPDALVTGYLPTNCQVAQTQRTRWEQGHLHTLACQVPRLLGAGLKQRRVDVLAMAVDLCVPPLSFLVMLWMAAQAIATGAALAGGAKGPAAALAATGLLMVMTLCGAWLKFGRGRLPLATLWAVPAYVMWKVPIYLGLLYRPQKSWITTRRQPAAVTAADPSPATAPTPAGVA